MKQNPSLMFLYGILESPFVYSTVQKILSVGGQINLRGRLETIAKQLPDTESLLDVGCGPVSFLEDIGLKPLGIDISENYVKAYKENGGEAVVGSADSLPFESDNFNSVWCLGVLHHLPDDVALNAVKEMCRVCSPGGLVVIIDNVWPEPSWSRPLAWLIRRMDRGEFVRNQDVLTKNIIEKAIKGWDIERLVYTTTGLEAIIAVHQKPLVENGTGAI